MVQLRTLSPWMGLAGLILIQLLTFYFGIVLNPLFLFFVPVLIVSVFWLIRHPEFTLLLIGFTSIIKGFLQEQVPLFETLDVTILLIFLLWLGLARVFISGEWHVPEFVRGLLVLFVLFSGVVLLSGLYTPSPESGGLKILRFLVFASSMFVSPFIFLNTQEDSARMLKSFKILSALILCAMLVNLLIIVNSGGLVTYLVRASLLGANPIAVSRSLAVIAAMVTVIGIRKSGWRRYASLFLLTLILLAIVSTGSRGPLISFFAGITVFTLMFESAVYRSRLFMVGGVSIIIVAALLFVLPESLTTRFLQITQGDIIVTAGGVERVSTIATRLNFWEMSLQRWADSVFSLFFGIGAGGFSSLFIWRDFRWYPHNIFVEVLVEQGLIGLILLCLMIVIAIQLFLKARNQGIISEHSSVWIASMIVIFFSAQFSGDLNDNRILLMFLAIALSSVHLDGLFIKERGSQLLA